MVRRFSLILVVAAVSFVTAPADRSGASAAAPDSTDALIALESEVAALVDLGAFPQPLPPRLVDVAAEWQDGLAGLDRSGLIDWVHSSESDGGADLAALEGTGQLSLPVRTALGPLSADDVRLLESGDTIRLPAEVYEAALNDLEYRDGAEPGPGANPPAQPPADGAHAPAQGSAPSTADAPSTTAEPAASGSGTELISAPAASSSPRSSGSALPLVGLGAAGLAVAGLATGLGRRRSRRSSAGRLDGSVTALLDASRRFGATVDVEEIHRILIVETVALTGALAAAVVMVDAAGRLVVVAESTDGTIVPAHLDRGVVRRVLDTGAAVRTVDADAAFGDGNRSILVVPLVRSGMIVGAVVALAAEGEPFEAVDLDVLGQIGPMAAAALVSASRHDDVAELSLTDGLTELGNRRRLDRDLVAALAVGTGTVGFVMVDIDHFKKYNDTHGHVAGDEALQRVARILRDSVREGDVVYRYGGEEFCVLLPEATADEAADVSERLRSAVEAHGFTGGETQPGGRLTISVGTTVAHRNDPTEVKERADHALYEAKHRGRNQVVVDGPDHPG